MSAVTKLLRPVGKCVSLNPATSRTPARLERTRVVTLTSHYNNNFGERFFFFFPEYITIENNFLDIIRRDDRPAKPLGIPALCRAEHVVIVSRLSYFIFWRKGLRYVSFFFFFCRAAFNSLLIDRFSLRRRLTRDKTDYPSAIIRSSIHEFASDSNRFFSTPDSCAKGGGANVGGTCSRVII